MNKIYNRELSWLQFNARVMQEAQDEQVPLLQRLRFLGIYSNNQDEFVKVRVANLIRYSAIKGRKAIRMTGDHTASELLTWVNQQMDKGRKLFYETYEKILKDMEGEGIYIVNDRELSQEQINFCREYYLSTISMRLVPIILRKRAPLAFLPDNKAYLLIKMRNEQLTRYAVIQIPVSDACPRFIKLPSQEGRTDIIFIDDVIRLFLQDIFFMFSYDTISAHTFKIVRDAELLITEDVSMSMAERMYEGVTEREKGKPIRLIYDRDMPLDALDNLSRKLNLRNEEQLEAGGKYHMLRDLMKFPKVNPELEVKNPKPMLHPLIDPSESILKVIRKQDILLCYPYQTFNHTIDFLRETAIDPRVKSIYITLYRTAKNSKIINALINGVKNGKKVTVLVELKARFDEEQNIDNLDILQKGGIKVITSPESLKVHSKLILVERSEPNGVRGYVYIGTGNFNENTSNIYSDFGLLTTNQTIAAEARKVFTYLENTHTHPKFKQLLVSPYYMRNEIEELIENEISLAQKGKKAYFHGKFNALTDEKMIELLYKASKAGVKIKLIVRGACCLEAGVKGMSENIKVISIVDRYLEHARLMIFGNGGKPQTYIMSADLMTRNLDRRVEVGVRINSKDIEKTLHKYFEIEWKDNDKARIIAPPYLNEYVKPNDDEKIIRSQTELHKLFEQ